MKMEDDLLAPFDVMDLHHILDKQISQDAILDQMNSDALSYACTTGNIRPLWEIAPENPLLMKGFTSGWMNRFIEEPFDPLCVMLAMRCTAMLDLVDQEGHSYNLIRKLGYGFIDFGEIPEEEPGDPGDYYPPEIDNPIDYPDIPTPPGPEPGEPGYVEPMPGDPGYVPPGPGDPGYVPGPGEPGYVEPGTTPNTHIGGGPGGGAPWGGGIGAGDLGGAPTPGGSVTPPGGDPCQDVDDPLETVTIGYTTQQMALSETQDFAVTGMHPRWSYENYTWKISGGGGSLALKGQDPPEPIYGPEEEGFDPDAYIATFEVTYTAPADNANCAKNPTIELWCGGAMMASLAIGINSYSAGSTAYEVKWITGYSGGNCVYSPYTKPPCDYMCGPVTYFMVAQYDCEGTELLRCLGSPHFCWFTNPVADVPALKGVCSDGFTVMGMGHPLGVTDRRSDPKIAMGCCPEELL